MKIETEKSILEKRVKEMNMIDNLFRKIQSNDNNYQVMIRVLDCLSDKQLHHIKKIIKLYIRAEKKKKKFPQRGPGLLGPNPPPPTCSQSIEVPTTF